MSFSTGGVRKVVVPAAGVGTRMLPASKSVPKELLPIVDRPLIHYIADECVQSGLREMILVCAPKKTALVEYFRRDRPLDAFLRRVKRSYLLDTTYRLAGKMQIRTTVQKEALGLGHAVACARRQVGRDPFFAVALPDDLIDSPTPCLKQMLALHRSLRASMVALVEVPASEVSRYGIVSGRRVGDNLLQLNELVEKPDEDEAPSRYAIVGRYILSRRIFQKLSNPKRGAKGEFQLTDALCELLKEEKVFGYLFQGTRYDAGSPVGYLRANLAYALKRPEFASLFGTPL